MYIRIIKGQTQPGQVDELAKRWRALIGPRLQEISGFRHAYFSGDRAKNTVAAVSVWDSRPDDAVMSRNIQDFLSQVADIVASQPVVEDYEVLEEL